MVRDVALAALLSESIVGVSSNALAEGFLADEVWHRVQVQGERWCSAIAAGAVEGEFSLKSTQTSGQSKLELRSGLGASAMNSLILRQTGKVGTR